MFDLIAEVIRAGLGEVGRYTGPRSLERDGECITGTRGWRGGDGVLAGKEMRPGRWVGEDLELGCVEEKIHKF